MTTAVAKGKDEEDLARRYLESRGLRLVEANFRCRGGELDLVMRDGAEWVFVEVRSRGGSGFGTPAATITRTKRRRLVRAAEYYLQRLGRPVPARFDVLAVQRRDGAPAIEWIRGAFEAW